MRFVCLTSNRYIHCLPPFAYLWQKFCGLPVTVACFEVQPKTLPPAWEIISLGREAEVTWSGGALRLLDLIDDEIFGLVLEDYLLSASVDMRVLGALIRLMEKRADIVKVDLTDDRLRVPHTGYGRYHGVELVRSADDAPWQMSVQAALWRRDFARRYWQADEDAWAAERNGTRRIIQARQAGKEGGVILGTRQPPVRYVNAVGGEGTMPGTWALHRFPQWMREELAEWVT